MKTIAAKDLTLNHIIAGQGVGLKPKAIFVRKDYIKVEISIGGLKGDLFYGFDDQVEIVG